MHLKLRISLSQETKAIYFHFFFVNGMESYLLPHISYLFDVILREKEMVFREVRNFKVVLLSASQATAKTENPIVNDNLLQQDDQVFLKLE